METGLLDLPYELVIQISEYFEHQSTFLSLYCSCSDFFKLFNSSNYYHGVKNIWFEVNQNSKIFTKEYVYVKKLIVSEQTHFNNKNKTVKGIKKFVNGLHRIFYRPFSSQFFKFFPNCVEIQIQNISNDGKIRIRDIDFKDLGKISSLELFSVNNVSSNIFKYLSNVENLIISGCNQISDSEYFKNLSKLRKLVIGCNNLLTSNIFKYFPFLQKLELFSLSRISTGYENLKNCSKLKNLSLGHDTRIPLLIIGYFAELEELSISSNVFTEEYNVKSEVFKSLKCLKSFKFEEINCLTDEIFGFIPNITSLGIFCSEIKLGESFSKLIQLKELDFGSSFYEKRVIQPNYIQKFENMEILRIDVNETYENRHFAFPKLKDLNIYWISNSKKEIKLSSGLLKNLVNLTTLSINFEEKEFQVFEEDFKYVPNLNFLLVTSKEFNSKGLKYLKKLKGLIINTRKGFLKHEDFENLSELRTLDLCHIPIDRKFFNCFKYIKKLNAINFSYISFGDECAKYFKFLSSLTRFSMSDNDKISTKFFKEKSNFPSLEFLFIYHCNNIKEKNIKRTCRFLSKKGLYYLD